MKKIRIAIIFLFTLIICMTRANAQENRTTMDWLTQSAWEITHQLGKDDHITSIWTFTKEEFTETSYIQGYELKIVCKYYLSNEPDTIFNPDKVGKIQKGQYIIQINKFQKISIYEIEKISEKEFGIYVLSKDDLVKDRQKMIKYKAIPKP